MHELSLVQNLIAIAESEIAKAGCKRATEFTIEVGAWSGVVIPALEFALETSVKGTVLEHAKCNIVAIPGKVRCKNCNTETMAQDFYSACQHCNTFDVEIIQGMELQLKSIKAEK